MESVLTLTTSETIGKLGLALSKAQAVMHPATKDKQNSFFKSKYADLSSVWESARQPLASNEICVIQTTGMVGADLFLITTMVHSSGEWIRGAYPIFPIKNDPQGIGSAVTYARRFSFASMVGVVTEDDDGESAVRGNRLAPFANVKRLGASVINTETGEVLAETPPATSTYDPDTHTLQRIKVAIENEDLQAIGDHVIETKGNCAGFTVRHALERFRIKIEPKLSKFREVDRLALKAFMEANDSTAPVQDIGAIDFGDSLTTKEAT